MYSIAVKGTIRSRVRRESRESGGFADNNTHPNKVELIVVVGVEQFIMMSLIVLMPIALISMLMVKISGSRRPAGWLGWQQVIEMLC